MKRHDEGDGLVWHELETGDRARLVIGEYGSTDYVEVAVLDGGNGLGLRCGDGEIVVLPHMANAIVVQRRSRLHEGDGS